MGITFIILLIALGPCVGLVVLTFRTFRTILLVNGWVAQYNALVPFANNVHLASVPGVYELKITVGLHYPMVPPTMMFVTKIFHPNIHFNVSRARILSACTDCRELLLGR